MKYQCKKTKFFLLISLSLLFCLKTLQTQAMEKSIAREWNEVLLEAIRLDFARPTVHARNLFHSSIAMYDIWALFDDTADTFLLDKKVGEFSCFLSSLDEQRYLNLPAPDSVIDEAISYAMYRLILHRFANSNNPQLTQFIADNLMNDLGYDTNVETIDMDTASGAALGNYMAQCLIDFGFTDGSNEQNRYTNSYYLPINQALDPNLPGNPDIFDPDRWQPLDLPITIDQSGNPIDGEIIFLSPEWGNVLPFSLTDNEKTTYIRDSNEYHVYHDPGVPALFSSSTEEYIWNNEVVAIWSSHLDPSDDVMWDISPATIGNSDSFPTTIAGLRDFYDRSGGGAADFGHVINPVTGQAYAPQLVPRGDYTRVLAEFWADGPDSETPPGHWFVILNELVNDHSSFQARFRGQGDVLDDLEWDVKAYFALSSALHDSAIAAWSIKGWYDYSRPISSIRYLQSLGQKSNPNDPDCAFNANGLSIEPGLIECVRAGDPLAGQSNQNVGKIKLYAWRGPDFIQVPAVDTAGVGWILAENWWPYQRPSFVTPPFAGYVSGHSTFSRAAAEVLTMITGNEFFPGGMGEFAVEQNEFLVFEDGPSVSFTLQWATYRDASDQTSLSRIWGGIHPPVDDIPGRLIGEKVGVSAFNLAEKYFTGDAPTEKLNDQKRGGVFNPLSLFIIIILLISRVVFRVYN